jgi:polyisoprenoid-binding protein YceI
MSNQTWKVDKAHSEAGFTISHLGIAEMSGFFKDFDIKIETQTEDFRDAAFEATILTDSLDTRIHDRDHHLKAADFFNVEQFPNAMIISREIINNGHGIYAVQADVTIKDKTKMIAMELFYHGKAENPMSKKTTAGFSLSATINRKDFGIGPEIPNLLLSDLVTIQFNGEFIL